MSLRSKATIIIVTISLLAISLVNGAARFILVRGFVNLEQEYTARNIQRALNVIIDENTHLETTVRDYAAWDDTYKFAQDLNSDYIASNLVPSTFNNLGINFFIFNDISGKTLFSIAYDLKKQESLTLSPEFLELILEKTRSMELGGQKSAAGLILFDNQPIQIATHLILPGDLNGPSRGLLTFGRFLGADFLKKISETTQLTIQLEPVENSAASVELKDAKKVAGTSPEVLTKIINSETIAGYALINDISGNPILILRSEMARDIYSHGYSTIMFFIYTVFFGVLFFVLTGLVLLDRKVISRITGLGKSVANVRISGAPVDRVSVTGKDEIGLLAVEINDMLQSLEEADKQLRGSKDELEKLVEERTASLVLVNEELKIEIKNREQSQQALLEAYDEIQLIITSISSIMVGVDSSGIVTLWNDFAAKKLGVTAAETIGMDFFQLPIKWDWERISREATRCMSNNQKTRLDDVFLGKLGEAPRVLGITMSPLHLKNSDGPGFLLIGSDITERRLLEKQLERSNKLEAIGHLAAGVAHEINTPTQLVASNLRFLGQQLDSVLGLIDKVYTLNSSVKNGTATLEMALAVEKAAAEVHLEFFRKEAPKAIEQSLVGIDRISRIVEAMRYYMHPGTKEKEVANLNQIIENSLSLSRNEWKNVAEVTTDLDPNLPVVECLPVEISQVMLNLVVNSAHAIQDARGMEPETKGQILISSRLDGDWTEVRVTDNGIGIVDEIRDKIFDPFFTTKDVGRGTGQGLAIAYSVIVNKHGGTLEFESEPGIGATFIVRLPGKAANG